MTIQFIAGCPQSRRLETITSVIVVEGTQVDALRAAGPAGLLSTPNPFREATHRHLILRPAKGMEARIFDARGRVMRTLFEPTSIEAGVHVFDWDRRDARNAVVVPGDRFVGFGLEREMRTAKIVVVH